MSNKSGIVHHRTFRPIDNSPQVISSKDASSLDTLISISLSNLIPDPNQARRNFSNLDELKESIKQHTLIEPIIVIPAADNKYIIIDGERRYRACKLLAEENNIDFSNYTVPAICKSKDIDSFAGLITNMIRENYSPLEIAYVLRALKDSRPNYTDKEVGVYIGRSRNLVSEYLSLLKLPQEIIDNELEHGVIPFNKLKKLAVGANEKNKEIKLSEYKKLVAKYSGEKPQINQSEKDDNIISENEKSEISKFSKKFITISKRIDATIMSIDKFKVTNDSPIEEKQAVIGKLDEIIAKAQEKKAYLNSND